METAERLDALRGETLASLARLEEMLADVTEARRDANVDDEHDPEGATIAFERGQVDAFRDAALARLAQIDRARGRLADGVYGRCEVCGEQIAAARLEARPAATRCIRHA